MKRLRENTEEALPRGMATVIVVWRVACVIVAVFYFVRQDLSPQIRDLSSTSCQLGFSSAFGSLTVARLFHLSAVAALLGAGLIIGISILKLLRLDTLLTISGALVSIVAGIVVLGDSILLPGMYGILDPVVFGVIVIILSLAVGAGLNGQWLLLRSWLWR